jgi:hypothetical protein
MKPTLTISVRTVAASMIAVAIALGAALVVPAVSGMPTGSQATVAVAQQADWGQLGSRQRGILNARNLGAPPQANMVMVQTKATPAL